MCVGQIEVHRWYGDKDNTWEMKHGGGSAGTNSHTHKTLQHLQMCLTKIIINSNSYSSKFSISNIVFFINLKFNF